MSAEDPTEDGVDMLQVEIEVEQGIKPGEQVALAAMNLLSEEERLKAMPARSAWVKKVMGEARTRPPRQGPS